MNSHIKPQEGDGMTTHYNMVLQGQRRDNTLNRKTLRGGTGGKSEGVGGIYITTSRPDTDKFYCKTCKKYFSEYDYKLHLREKLMTEHVIDLDINNQKKQYTDNSNLKLKEDYNG